jgi:DNA-binding GntR family transcriptional regulator
MTPSSQKLRAYEHLRDRLMFGEFPAGSRLSDVALAKNLGISRTPIREALHLLASEGFVEQVPGFGTFMKSMDRRELEEIYHLRELLEADSAERAASRLRSNELEELQQLCDESRAILERFRRTEGSKDVEDVPREWIVADLSFHMLILRASGNRKIMKIVSDSRMMTAVFAFKRYDPSVSLLNSMTVAYRQHCGILKALRKSDGAAAGKLMRAHLRDSRRRALAHYEWEQTHPSRAESSLRADPIRQIIHRMETYSDAGSKF